MIYIVGFSKTNISQSDSGDYMFKRKTIIRKEHSIIISKEITTKKSNNEAVLSTYSMKFGIFDNLVGESKTPKYLVGFMTMNGIYKYKVPKEVYHKTRIDSLGELSHNKRNFINFKFIKIATKLDVERLGWKT